MLARTGDLAAVRGRSAMRLYLGIAFGMAWVFWGLAWLISRGKVSLPIVPVLMIGSFGPFVGALVTTWTKGGARQARRFFGKVFDPRMGWPVFLVSFFLMPAFAAIAELLHAAATHSAPRFTMSLWDVPLSYLFLTILGGTLAEEYGWSLLSDQLDEALPLIRSTFMLGLVWALWHLPLFFIVTPGMIQGYTPFYIFLVVTVSLRFLFAWAYHRGNRSILSNMLFHTASNMAYSMVPLAPSPADLTTDRLWMFGLLIILSAAILWIVAPPRQHPERR